MLRLDDDILFLEDTKIDLFQDMHRRNLSFGWAQWSRDHVPSRTVSGMYPLSRQFACDKQLRQFPLSLVYNMTRRIGNLNAGCLELYRLDVFQNDHYLRYLMYIQMWHGLSRFYLEQAFKSIWVKMYVPPDAWRYYGCDLSVAHKSQKESPRWFFRHNAERNSEMCLPGAWGHNITYQRALRKSHYDEPPSIQPEDVCGPEADTDETNALNYILPKTIPVDPSVRQWSLPLLLKSRGRLAKMQE
eukprot:NODE_2101_length_987_cov_108.117271_g1718_i0.p1 GENE.NODE_2101_length_987_cov_108.117271_g1718_i0~~NODE_2101_length_987_cov_108.117271_g1718_i0.p1  ORF type:complete len:244 (+),score=42.65 NODE_2101_length_987_cov_108.117271_g1718_i0:244-975(+)